MADAKDKGAPPPEDDAEKREKEAADDLVEAADKLLGGPPPAENLTGPPQTDPTPPPGDPTPPPAVDDGAPTADPEAQKAVESSVTPPLQRIALPDHTEGWPNDWPMWRLKSTIRAKQIVENDFETADGIPGKAGDYIAALIDVHGNPTEVHVIPKDEFHSQFDLIP